ncbi:hypothetical protein MAR_029369 [Mya arenaria]|uniref:Uncharacterized protein n=1 Tax=Mya arenaria TaxID=6604 RepID=A0ABY7DJL7_MYAAR|nr:hypothetical protein MAR_029369 [Mya arenaria]
MLNNKKTDVFSLVSGFRKDRVFRMSSLNGNFFSREDAKDEEEEAEPVKMSYTVKLDSFTPEKKVALIKEIKTLMPGTNLVQEVHNNFKVIFLHVARGECRSTNPQSAGSQGTLVPRNGVLIHCDVYVLQHSFRTGGINLIWSQVHPDQVRSKLDFKVCCFSETDEMTVIVKSPDAYSSKSTG